MSATTAGCVPLHAMQHLESVFVVGDGILLIVSQASVIGRLARRGPDLTKEVTFPLKCGKQLYLLGTLLQMRGHSTPQPLSGSATPTKDAGMQCVLVLAVF